MIRLPTPRQVLYYGNPTLARGFRSRRGLGPGGGSSSSGGGGGGSGGGGGGSLPDFFVDWRTAPGTTDPALLDGGKLDTHSGPAFTQGIVAVNNLVANGMPATLANIFIAIFNTTLDDAQVRWTSNRWAPPADGQKRYYRIYRTQSGNLGNNGHTFQNELLSGSIGPWEFRDLAGAAGSAGLNFVLDAAGSGLPVYPNNEYFLNRGAGGAPQNIVFRIEWSMRRSGLNVHVDDVNWYYEPISATVPIYTKNGNYVNDVNNAWAGANDPDIPGVEMNSVFTRFAIGNNDIGVITSPTAFIVYGAFATSLLGFPGPYNVVTG